MQRTRRAGTQPSRCRLPSHRTPVTSANRAINLLGALPLPIQWFTSPYQQPAILQLFSYPEFLLVFKEAFQDMSHCLKAHIKEIGIPIILHLSALSTLHFHLPFLPVLLFLSFFFLYFCSCFCFLLFFSFFASVSLLSINNNEHEHCILLLFVFSSGPHSYDGNWAGFVIPM